MRKSDNMSPYPTPQNKDDNFKQEVFRRDNKIPNLGIVFSKKKILISVLIEFFLKIFFVSDGSEWKQHDTSKCHLQLADIHLKMFNFN